MQYILTQEEYHGLIHRGDQRVADVQKTLQELCTEVANHKPIFPSWDKTGEPAPWMCMLTEELEHYCDECPVRKQCPCDHKRWSQ